MLKESPWESPHLLATWLALNPYPKELADTPITAEAVREWQTVTRQTLAGLRLPHDFAWLFVYTITLDPAMKPGIEHAVNQGTPPQKQHGLEPYRWAAWTILEDLKPAEVVSRIKDQQAEIGSKRKPLEVSVVTRGIDRVLRLCGVLTDERK